MSLTEANPNVVRAYIASVEINSRITGYGICVHWDGNKIVAFGTVPGNQRTYAQMVALDNILSAVDEAGLSELALEVILWRDHLRVRLEMARSRKLIGQLGQSVREAIEDPERWDDVSMRSANTKIGLPLTDAEQNELSFIDKLLYREFILRNTLRDGPLVLGEAELSLDISDTRPLPDHSGYLLSPKRSRK